MPVGCVAMAKNKLLEAALTYEEMGFSVIPIIPGQKKPMVKWESFQKQRATRPQIISWWSATPDANIGIVTGEISDLFVVDIDTEEGQQNLLQYGFDNASTPIVKTPRGGQHLYFKYPKGRNITIGAGKIKGTDFRGNGGYVLAPPSKNGEGKPYQWIVDLSHERSLAMPEAYLKIISTLYIGNVDKTKDDSLQVSTESTNVYNENIWEVGKRDDSLFRLAYTLALGKCTKEYAFQVLISITESWGEHDEKWIQDKIESAWKRAKSKERNLMQDIRDDIVSTSGVFLSTEQAKRLQLSTREELKNQSICLKRAVTEGLIVKYGSKSGQWRTVDQDEEPIDWENADTTPLDIKFPLNVHEYVKIHKGNVIVVAGESNAGKTAYCMNFALKNKDLMPVNYMSSEMKEGSELKIRMDEFHVGDSAWRAIKFTFRTDNYPDKINPDGINIIDYLDEGSDAEAYKMPMRIRLIADKLQSGIVVIAIQKDPNKQFGFGGAGTMNRSRVYLTIQRKGILTIEKAKIWRDKNDNPDRKFIQFKLAAGCRFTPVGQWKKQGETLEDETTLER